MLRTLTYSFLIFGLWALFGRWYYVCRIRGCECCETNSGMSANFSNLRLSKDGAIDILRGYEQFSFAQNATTPSENANNIEFLTKTAAYLKENAGETLTITACSRQNESSDLGLKRAEMLSAALQKLGIEASRIKNASCVSSNDLHTAAAFSLSGNGSGNVASSNTSNNGDAASTKDSYLEFDISDENFAFNSAIFSPKQNFIDKANQLITYSQERKSITLSVIGHTDSKGSDAYNIKLGQRRADAVKNYLQKKGLNIAIKTGSEGESAPIASNDTEEGMAKNRRVHCKVNQ